VPDEPFGEAHITVRASFGRRSAPGRARAATVCLALAAMLLASGAELRGQNRNNGVDSASVGARGATLARCDSILRANRRDSVRVPVRVQILRTDGGVLPSDFRSLLAQELMLRLELPHPLAVPTFTPGPTRLRMLRPEGDATASLREPEIYGVYHLRLLRNGSADSLSVVIPSLAPGLDSSVINALRTASRERTFPMFADALAEDTVRLQLRVASTAEEPRLRGSSIVLFHSMFPRVLVADAVPSVENPRAPYPEEEHATGADGDVLLRGVIDVDGMPVIPTMEVIHATSRAFALSALRTIARWRFTPAQVSACPVQQVVLVPFWFSLRP
jgi:hypothetical protein